MIFGQTFVRVLLASLVLASACLACADSYVARVTLFDGPCITRPKFVDYLCDKRDYGEGNAQTHQNVAQWFHTLQASFETKDPSVKATLNSWGAVGMSKRARPGPGNNVTTQHTELSSRPFSCTAVQPGTAVGFNVRYHW
ncbi:hypothetical protein MCAP1_002791 [Malassezia caprae]|uniref:Secreted protein n=1 Tax=Malassezia caprae TaxID=1381934 RepID=A0AAF0IW82_9BASI|nr:hypothetical protein MCAP1_002791 [Malassezia caprae]